MSSQYDIKKWTFLPCWYVRWLMSIYLWTTQEETPPTNLSNVVEPQKLIQLNSQVLNLNRLILITPTNLSNVIEPQKLVQLDSQSQVLELNILILIQTIKLLIIWHTIKIIQRNATNRPCSCNKGPLDFGISFLPPIWSMGISDDPKFGQFSFFPNRFPKTYDKNPMHFCLFKHWCILGCIIYAIL